MSKRMPGLIYGLSRAEYDGITGRIRWSVLKEMATSPMHYLTARDAPPDSKQTPSKLMGSAVHASVLEPERFNRDYVVWPGERKGKEWTAFKEQHEGRLILNASEAADCQGMTDAVLRHPIASQYLKAKGQSEVAVLWELDRFACKARVDKLADDFTLELKTTKSAKPTMQGFFRESANYRYHTQAAYYWDGVGFATGRRRKHVVVAVENGEPYCVVVYHVPQHILEAGREEYLDLIGMLDACEREGSFGGYADTSEVELELPRWATPNLEEELHP